MDTAAVSQFGERNLSYVARLYGCASSNCADNFALCPSSLIYHFAAIYAATKAATKSAKEIATTFRLGLEDVSKINRLLDTMTSALHFHTMKNLYCAKKMYVDKGAEIDETYAEVLDKIFHISVEKAKFANKQEASRDINDWVREVTAGNYDAIVDAKDIPRDSELMIVNALHFRGEWSKSFDVTRDIFYHLENKSSEIDMLTKIDEIYYLRSDELKAQFLKMPYDDTLWKLTVVLPDTGTTLNSLESNLEEVIRSGNCDYELKKIRISLPKFDVETVVDLKSIFKDMGLSEIFDNETNFSGIKCKGSFVPIGSIIQKTLVGLDARGSKSCNQINETTEDVVSLKVDRPFLFYIQVLNVVIFIGRYLNPL